MPTVESRLKDDIKAAMKAGQKEELAVLRTIMADAKNVAISQGLDRTGLSDDLMLKVLRKAIKSRMESAALYSDAGRKDLADVETFQIGVIKRYMPAEVSEAEIELVVDTVMVEMDTSDKSAMGKVIKEALARLEGGADGKTVQRIVASRLG